MHLKFFSKNNNSGFTQHFLFYKKKNRGFTLLFASLIGGLLLLVGVAMLGVTIKQLSLSSAGRESQKAFYAADTARECAIYLDEIELLGTCALFPKPGSALPPCSNLTCAGVPIIVSNTINNLLVKEYTFSVDNNTEDLCFDVTVNKKIENPGSEEYTNTQIVSRGYNTCVTTNPDRFERAIKYTVQ